MPATSHASRRGARPPRTRRPSRSDGTCSSRRATERLRSCKSTEGRERLSARQRAYRGNCRFHPVPRRGGPASRRTAFGNVRATSPSTSPAWASTSPRRACSTMSVPSGSSFQFLRTASRRRRLQRFRVAALPTLRVTVRPIRAGRSASVARRNTMKSLDPCRTPLS